MENLIDLMNDLQLNDELFNDSFMEFIYQYKNNQINYIKTNNQNIEDIYDGDSVVSTYANYDKMMDYEDGIQ